MARSLNPDPRDDAPEAGPLSLADLRDVSRLRQDLARSEEEIRLLREQLGHALAGWHTEQLRALALEQRLNEQASPPPAVSAAGEGGAEAEATPDVGMGTVAPAEVAEHRPATDPDTRATLLTGLLDFLRD